ncbi:MAG: hypothetical protein IJ744_05925 [Lachnospiraceae bacterium]|nr:hypothetical protein [Lachnospiraceae bacterium]
MNSVEYQAAIDRILNRPVKEPTKEEALEFLRKHGFLDENYEIVPAFQGIIHWKDPKKKWKD